MTNILIALAAGCAAALMFASVSQARCSRCCSLWPRFHCGCGLGWGPLPPPSAASWQPPARCGVRLLFASLSSDGVPRLVAGASCALGRPTANATVGNGAAPVTRTGMVPGRPPLLGSPFAADPRDLVHLGTDAAPSPHLRAGARQSRSAVRPPGDEIEQRIDGCDGAGRHASTMALAQSLAGRDQRHQRLPHRPWPVRKPAAAMTLSRRGVRFCFTTVCLRFAKIPRSADGYALIGLAVLHTLTLGFKSRRWLAVPTPPGGAGVAVTDDPRPRRRNLRITPTLFQPPPPAPVS